MALHTFGSRENTGRRKDPRTKEELLDRMMSFDFDGDIRNVGRDTALLQRLAPNRVSLTFPASGVTYELTIHRPRHIRELDRVSEVRTWEE